MDGDLESIFHFPPQPGCLIRLKTTKVIPHGTIYQSIDHLGHNHLHLTNRSVCANSLCTICFDGVSCLSFESKENGIQGKEQKIKE